MGAIPVPPGTLPAHLPLLDLKWGGDEGWTIDSQAMLTTTAHPRAAIIFVHGWGGTAVETWDDFYEIVRTSPRFAPHDIYFFGYPSREHTTAFCAARFRAFLKDLLLAPDASVVRPTLATWGSWLSARSTYQRVLLCAHSMGAVVVRRALADLDLDVAVAPVLPNVRLLLFAPANKGSSLPRLILEGTGRGKLPGARAVATALRVHYRSLDDLEIGSPALERLESDTYDRLRARRTPSLDTGHLTASVLHAQHDKVVVQEPFADDLPWDAVMHEDHSSICKPRAAYQLPVERVEGAI